MSEQKDVVDVMGMILSSVRGVVGEDAYEAMFHYAAVQEGKRIASEGKDEDLETALGRLDDVLGQRSRLIQNGSSTLRIHVIDSPLIRSEDTTMRALMIGLLQGLVSARQRRPYHGKLLDPPEDGFRGMLVELSPNGGGGRG